MKTSESIKKLIESNQEKQTIITGNWKAIKEDNEITIYYYNTLVGSYNIVYKSLLLVYDYSVSTKCGLTKIKNELSYYSLVKSLIYTNRNKILIDYIKL